MVTITIDGKQYKVEKNQTILEAAVKEGIEIPYFCWHPELSVSGNCRMCLVEVEKTPKLVIACMTPVMDGMVVNTKNDRVITARKAVMEFLLINHPLDCPICDEAGECKLQDYAYNYSTGVSRFDETKVHKPKRVPFGPYVMFDGERCILCSRCIRFCDEIAGKKQLHFVQRGDHTTIETFPGEELDNPYSMNVIDICPVGALTSRDFRFRSRVWEMTSTDSVCIGCARGCNTHVWTRTNQILRLTPRINEEVNSHWLCDKGRLTTFRFVNDDLRVRKPLIREGEKQIEISWQKALQIAAGRLKEYKPKQIAVVASAYATNEDNYAFLRFAREELKVKTAGFFEHVTEGDTDDILIRDDKTPNSKGAALIMENLFGDPKAARDELLKELREKKIKALIVMNEDIAASEDFGSLLENVELLIVHSWSHNKTTMRADVVFSAATYAEMKGTFTNFEGRVQIINPAVVTKGHNRALDGMSMSRLDKFGTRYDKWGRGKEYDARPAWKVFTELANIMGAKIKRRDPEDLFGEIAGRIPSFKGLSYKAISKKGAKISADQL